MSARRGVAAALTGRARDAAAEAALLRLLGLLFERPRRGWAGEVRSLAADQTDERLRATALGALAASEGEYLRLFGPGGSVSPREVAYRGLADPGRLLADLCTLYDQFAYHPRAEDPRDHVAVEVGFAGYLAMKEAYLLASRDRQGVLRTRAAKGRFLATHLRPFATGIETRLTGVAASSWLAAAASILAGWTGRDARGGASGEAGPLFGAIDLEAPVTCDGCGVAPPTAAAGTPIADPAGEL